MLRIQVTALLTILAASAVMRASLLPVAGSADLFLLRAFAERLADVGPHDSSLMLLFSGATGVGMGLIAPSAILARMRRLRQERIRHSIPDSLDLLRHPRHVRR